MGGFREFIGQIMGKLYTYTVYQSNETVPQTAVQDWVHTVKNTTRFGMMPAQAQGDVVTAQTMLRGVLPIYAAEVARKNNQQVSIS